MLYLIDPRGHVYEAETTLGAARARERVDGRPVADQNWHRAAMLLDYDDYLDIALRHGVTCSKGLLLDAGFVKHALAPSQLKASGRNQEAVAVQVQAVGRDTEDRSTRLHERAMMVKSALSGHSSRLSKAEDKAREILQADVRQDLVEHWHRLGGILPEATSAELHGT
jgi:hypothetical protein